LRFQLWCRAYGLGLKDVRYEHLVAYTAFLAKIPAEWINPVKLPRTDPDWRPFARQLSDRSQRQAMIVIKSLLTWMHNAEYLPKNPAKLLGKLNLPLGETVTRYLPTAGIDYLYRAADGMPADKPSDILRRARARFLVRAYYNTATRLSELVNANMDSLRPDDHGEWWLHVIGKGNKAGQVPVPADLVEEYGRYRHAFGLPTYPDDGEELPLLLTSRGPVRRLSDYAAGRAIKQLLQAAAQLAKDDGQHHLVKRLKQASTHWLRHSILTHQVNAGMPIKTVQLNARHADISTTGHYVHKEGRERHAETVAALEALNKR
jgi:site-specific recombinase XerD